MKTLIAIAAFTCASFHVHAEKWVNVGVAVSTRVGPADIYADADSAVRTGDLAKIKFKALAEPKIDEVNFDCKKNLMFSNFGDQFSTDNDLVVAPAKPSQPA